MFAGRIRLLVRYDGTGFSGSQIQPGKRTVQGTLKAELERITGHPVQLIMASRTDSGVHADGNVCACDARLPFPVQRLAAVLNRQLPPDLEIRQAEAAPAGFHPRFDAVSRTYVYRIFRSSDVPVDRRRYVWACSGDWDEQSVADCLALLPGMHAFQRFAAGSLPPERALCRVYSATAMQCGLEQAWEFTANRFLRSMVCRIAGALAAVGLRRLSCSDFRAALDGHASLRFRPAPPRGLVLRNVIYAGESRQYGEEQ